VLPAEEFGGVAGVARTVPAALPSGGTVLVSRPEYSLIRSASRGRAPGVEAAVRAVRSLGVDRELLDLLLSRSSLSEEARASLRSRARG